MMTMMVAKCFAKSCIHLQEKNIGFTVSPKLQNSSKSQNLPKSVKITNSPKFTIFSKFVNLNCKLLSSFFLNSSPGCHCSRQVEAMHGLSISMDPHRLWIMLRLPNGCHDNSNGSDEKLFLFPSWQCWIKDEQKIIGSLTTQYQTKSNCQTLTRLQRVQGGQGKWYRLSQWKTAPEANHSSSIDTGDQATGHSYSHCQK